MTVATLPYLSVGERSKCGVVYQRTSRTNGEAISKSSRIAWSSSSTTTWDSLEAVSYSRHRGSI